MSRSPLAYPLTRGIDGDSGGAADLQTDIMRFMAILSLCLVAIFALVQSIPLAAVPTPQAVVDEPAPSPAEPEPLLAEPAADNDSIRTRPVAKTAATNESEPVIDEPIALTRPRWVPKFQARAVQAKTLAAADSSPVEPVVVESEPVAVTTSVATSEPVDEREGFTLRFESDLALTRLVATGQVGFYALEAGRAQRMSVSDSRISFWDASTPNAFHEMEASTVPGPVVDALKRTGTNSAAVDWGVTLPGKLQAQLSTLMQQYSGGALIIGADGNLNLEAS